MFAHIYLNRLKITLRDRQMIFWTFLFPLILASFFRLAFSNLAINEQFFAIPVAVVDNAAYQADSALRSALQAVSEPEQATDTPLFRLRVLTLAEAEAALTERSIAGYLIPGETLQVVVAFSGIRQTILKLFLDEYLQTRSAIGQIVQIDPTVWPALAGRLATRIDLLRNQPISTAKPDEIMLYYFALIAMTCFYGGFLGLKEIYGIQADQSGQAARINLAPVPKMQQFLCSMAAALTVHYLSLLLLIAYLRFVLGISFGNRIGAMMLAALVGSLLGVAFGGLIGAVLKGSEGIKNAVLIAVSMTLSFFSGLMFHDIKYIVIRRFPAMSYLNPANLISDTFYALYYYDNFARYTVNMVLQAGLVLVLFGVVALAVRRQRYASL